MKYHTYPSLKYEDDRLHLWDGLMRRDLSFTATDSSFTTYLDKIAGRNVVDVRGGNIGIEIRMGVNYTEAVVRRGMSLEHYVNVTSTNAAKLLGLYPRKGAIAAGSDADITIIDPSIKKEPEHGRPSPAGLQSLGRLGNRGLAHHGNAAGQGDGGQRPAAGNSQRRPVDLKEDRPVSAEPSGLLITNLIVRAAFA